ncbi:MAG: acyl-CoA dehydrogenase family protein [Deltaproteobacteria bacterium]|nr:acyl-CoA dehydrogenase family protein [Deltaproteobacteria bacterium]
MGEPAMDREALDLIIETVREYAARKLPLARRLGIDQTEESTEAIIRELLGPEIGLHLVFIPEEYGGMDGGAHGLYRVCEVLARIDLGIATALFACALGTDPLRVGATPAQKERWLRRIADEGLVVAYGATEPNAGSNLAALRTTAEPVTDAAGNVTHYRLNGEKQFITNGAIADLYTILAKTPGGPSFFVVERGTAGLAPGRTEEKHGIRASNTAQVILEDCVIPADQLVGGEEGKGLAHASQVFSYTRLMVAAFGLGAGEEALARAVAYARDRVQFDSALIAKQGFTHRLLVPHAVRLSAARAYIEEVAARLDGGSEPELPTEGAIAKLVATEAGNRAAEAAIQAHGGYGYVREYEVEKIKRDVRITMIYEGTSEILMSVIALTRWQDTLRTKGRFHLDLADELERLDPSGTAGGPTLALAFRALGATLAEARKQRLTRSQHVQFRLAETMAELEAAGALVRKAVRGGDEALKTRARVRAREAALEAAQAATEIVVGAGTLEPAARAAFEASAGLDACRAAQAGRLADLDRVAKELAG